MLCCDYDALEKDFVVEVVIAFVHMVTKFG